MDDLTNYTSAQMWAKPRISTMTVTDVAFGITVLDYMPKWEEIPEDFRFERGKEAQKWINVISDWFYKGIKITCVKAKGDIDKDNALNQIKLILKSFEPQHEHKTAAASWLMSMWFEKFEYETVKK